MTDRGRESRSGGLASLSSAVGKRAAWAQNPWIVGAILALVVVAISVQSAIGGVKHFDQSGFAYTHYNNYVIFRQSYTHLVAGQDLYRLYPAEYWDLFKYSPAFALLVAPLAWMPVLPGLILWNACNALMLLAGFSALPGLAPRARMYAFAFVLIELITSLQSAQSNALIAGLIILALVQLESRRVALATLFITLTVVIKLFGVVAFALLLLYPGRWKGAAWALAWIAIFAALPLLVVDVSQLTMLYRSWYELLQNDHSASLGLSVSGWLVTWFGVEQKLLTVAAGAVLFCLPLLRRSLYRDLRFRALYLASCLLWIVIFNHKAESPTFVIAIAGVAIWFAFSEPSPLNVALLLLTFVFTNLSSTDVFPRSIKVQWVTPYVLKAVPCILVWMKIVLDQVTMSRRADAATTRMPAD